MKAGLRKLCAGIISALAFSFTANAQDLVYTPVNPAFGGSSFNYQWLQSSADAQNDFKEEFDFDRFGQESDLERFTEALNQQLLSQISRELFQNEFGSTGLTPGIYQLGALSLEIFPSSQGLVINILDTTTGDTSQIIIPQ